MWLAEAGLYHYKARIYDPGLGRFLQTDPIGYADGLNLYAYVGGDPVNFVDPRGNCRTPLSVAVGAVLGAGLGLGVGIVTEFVAAGAEGREVNQRNIGINAVAGLVAGAIGGAATGATCDPVTGAGIGLGVATAIAGPIAAAATTGIFSRLLPPLPAQQSSNRQRGTVTIIDVSTYDPVFGFSPGIQLSLAPGSSGTQVGTVSLEDVPTPDPDARGSGQGRGGRGGRGGGGGADLFDIVAASGGGGGGSRRPSDPIITIEDKN